MKKLFCTLATVLLLSGCGVKPSDVVPPQGASKETYPRTYPDPSTNPQR